MRGDKAKRTCENMNWDIERLNVHSHHGCNLRCFGCNHHSQFLHVSESININEMIESLKIVLSKIKIGHVAVLGGEPMLNPEGTKKICQFLIDNNQRLKLVTNGYKIDKHADWFIDLVRQGMIVKISSHLAPIRDKGGVKNLHEINSFLSKCLDSGVNVYGGTNKIIDQKLGWVERTTEWNSVWYSTFNYKGNKVFPYDSDKEDAFSICEHACPQLYKGRLYKCSHSAYFQEYLSINGQLEDSEWQHFIKEHGWDIYSDEGISEFLNNVYKPEGICSSCPSSETIQFIYHVQDESIVKKKIPIKEII